MEPGSAQPCPVTGQGTLGKTGTQGVSSKHEEELFYCEGGRALAHAVHRGGEVSFSRDIPQMLSYAAAVGNCFGEARMGDLQRSLPAPLVLRFWDLLSLNDFLGHEVQPNFSYNGCFKLGTSAVHHLSPFLLQDPFCLACCDSAKAIEITGDWCQDSHYIKKREAS